MLLKIQLRRSRSSGVEWQLSTLSGISRRTGHLSTNPSSVRYFFAFDLVGFIVEVSSEVAEFPLGLYVFGAVGNIATLGGASAECFRV